MSLLDENRFRSARRISALIQRSCVRARRARDRERVCGRSEIYGKRIYTRSHPRERLSVSLLFSAIVFFFSPPFRHSSRVLSSSCTICQTPASYPRVLSVNNDCEAGAITGEDRPSNANHHWDSRDRDYKRVLEYHLDIIEQSNKYKWSTRGGLEKPTRVRSRRADDQRIRFIVGHRDEHQEDSPQDGSSSCQRSRLHDCPRCSNATIDRARNTTQSV